MRELRQVPAEPLPMLRALRAALAGDGPAVLPVASGVQIPALPESVQRRVAVVVMTSGSTGESKAVMLSADALLASAAAAQAALGGPGQWLLALPTGYVAGVNVLVRSIAAGTEPMISPPGHFDPMIFVDTAERMTEPLRFVSLVPTQLADLIREDRALEVLRRFTRILVGGQSTPASLVAACLELGLNVTRSYGSSETCGGCVYDGVPIAGTRARVVDGQLELGGPTLADGYLADPARTAAAFYTDAGARWYRTGDTGTVIDGIVRVSGRIDDVIVSGGVNVSLAAVEAIVRTLPGLSDAVVVPRDSERWGQVPVVVCTTTATLADVRSAVSARLGAAASPADIMLVEHLPTLASGKPDRRALAARANRMNR